MSGVEIWEANYEALHVTCGAGKLPLDEIYKALKGTLGAEPMRIATLGIAEIVNVHLAAYEKSAKYVTDPENYKRMGRTNWPEYVLWRKAMRVVSEAVSKLAKQIASETV